MSLNSSLLNERDLMLIMVDQRGLITADRKSFRLKEERKNWIQVSTENVFYRKWSIPKCWSLCALDTMQCTDRVHGCVMCEGVCVCVCDCNVRACVCVRVWMWVYVCMCIYIHTHESLDTYPLHSWTFLRTISHLAARSELVALSRCGNNDEHVAIRKQFFIFSQTCSQTFGLGIWLSQKFPWFRSRLAVVAKLTFDKFWADVSQAQFTSALLTIAIC